MTNSPTQTRGNVNTRIDELLKFGMEIFNQADLYVSPSKISKLVRPVLREAGYDRAKAEIITYFERRTDHDLASYDRALRTSSIRNIAYVGEQKKAPDSVAADRGEDQNTNA